MVKQRALQNAQLQKPQDILGSEPQVKTTNLFQAKTKQENTNSTYNTTNSAFSNNFSKKSSPPQNSISQNQIVTNPFKVNDNNSNYLQSNRGTSIGDAPSERSTTSS